MEKKERKRKRTKVCKLYDRRIKLLIIKIVGEYPTVHPYELSKSKKSLRASKEIQ